jgi:HME family heavy-metal exporter
MGVILYGRFGRLAPVLIVFGNLPLAAACGVLALGIAQIPISVASVVGLVTLAGIAARNSILKLSRYDDLRRDGTLSLRERVVRGSVERLTPVLMTALVAALCLVPLLIGGDAPGKEVLHPVAVALFGGLIGGTLLDSFVTPTLALMTDREAASPAPAGISLFRGARVSRDV